jgi:hypothetical protein
MSSPERWVGITTDPAETERWCAWLRTPLGTVFVYPWKVVLDRGC